MKQLGLKRAFLIAAVVACGVFGSVDWSQNDDLSLSASSAQARVGRPATPVSAWLPSPCSVAPKYFARSAAVRFM